MDKCWSSKQLTCVAMKKNILAAGIFSFVLAVSLSMGGCYYDNAEDLYPPVATDTTDTTTTFTDDILPILTTRCATSSGCHASGSSYPVFESYDQIKAQVSRIQARAIDEKTMPPAGNPAPTQAQLDQLQQWINDGAPNN